MVLAFVKAESIAMKRVTAITTTIVRTVLLSKILQIMAGASRKTRVRSAMIIRVTFSIKELENIYTDESFDTLRQRPLSFRLACGRRLCR